MKARTDGALAISVLALAVACGGGHEQDIDDKGYGPQDSMQRRAELAEILRQYPDDAAARAELETLDHQADLNFGMITEIFVTENHRVKFMEPSEGALVIVEEYKLGHKQDLNIAQPLYALWEQIAKGKDMPPALVRLAEEEQLALALRAENPENPEGENEELSAEAYMPDAEPTEALVDKHQTSDPRHFDVDQRGCNSLGKSIKWRWCWLNRTGFWREGPRSGEAIATALSVYNGVGLHWRNRMGSDIYGQWLDAGQGTSFIGKVGTNWLGTHVDQDLGSEIDVIVETADWHWGGSISGDWSTVHTFGGYAMHL